MSEQVTLNIVIGAICNVMNNKPLLPHPSLPARQGFRNHPSWRSGFSLVEVTLAIGILSFGLLSVIGLMPVGLNAFRQSINASVGTQISQRLMNEKRQTDFVTLIAPANATEYRYFSDEGDEVPATSSIFVAKILVANASAVPSSGNSRFTNSSLAKVEVRLTHSPGGSTSLVDASPLSPQASVFTFYIPKT